MNLDKIPLLGSLKWFRPSFMLIRMPESVDILSMIQIALIKRKSCKLSVPRPHCKNPVVINYAIDTTLCDYAKS